MVVFLISVSGLRCNCYPVLIITSIFFPYTEFVLIFFVSVFGISPTSNFGMRIGHNFRRQICFLYCDVCVCVLSSSIYSIAYFISVGSICNIFCLSLTSCENILPSSLRASGRSRAHRFYASLVSSSFSPTPSFGSDIP